MVFATLKKNGLHTALRYRCTTRYPHPDGNYAAFLAEKYWLRPYEYVEDEPAPASRVLDSELPYYDVFAAMGMAVGDGSFGQLVPIETHIHGGYGEFGGASP